MKNPLSVYFTQHNVERADNGDHVRDHVPDAIFLSACRFT